MQTTESVLTVAEGTELRQVVERVGDWRSEMACDAGGRVVRNIALTGAVSKNGRRYTEIALREAVALYEGKPVFLDHAASGARTQERSSRDRVGTITKPRFEQGRIRGDIAVVNTEAGNIFLALVESGAPVVGMSHVVLVERGSDPNVIEKIADVVSVDAVAFPATVTLSEAEDSPQRDGDTEEDGGSTQHPVHSTQEGTDGPGTGEGGRVGMGGGPHPGPLPGGEGEEAVKPQATQESAKKLREQLDAVTNERDELRIRVEALEREQRVERMIEEAEFAPGVVTEAFRRALLDAPDDGTRHSLIEDRRALWDRIVSRGDLLSETGRKGESTVARSPLSPLAKGGRPQSRERITAVGGMSEEDVVRVIRGK